MQPGCACLKQLLAEAGNDFNAKLSTRLYIIPIAFELLRHPARQLGTTIAGEAREVGEVGYGHNAGVNRLVDASFLAMIHKVMPGIDAVEVLGDGTVRAGVQLGFQKIDIRLIAFGVRVNLRVSSYFQMKMITGVLADKFDQFFCVDQSGCAHAGRQVAAQGNNTINARVLVAVDQLQHGSFVVAAKGQVRCHGQAFGLHGFDNTYRVVTSRAASTIGH